MPIDPVKIPQNVYIEDRIVGPLTLRQILMVAIGGGISYALWATINKAYGGHLGIVPTAILFTPAVVSALFAFVTINDLSLLRILLLMIEKMTKPAARVWTPRQGLVVNIRTFSGTPKKEEAAEHTTILQHENRLTDLSSALDAAVGTLAAPRPHLNTSLDGLSSEAASNVNVRGADLEPDPDILPSAVIRTHVAADPLKTERAVDGIRRSPFRGLSPA